MPRFSARSRGVTLIELLIAMVLLLMVSLACIQTLQSNTKDTMATFKRIQANQYVDQIINHLRRSDVKKLESSYRTFPQIITNPDYSAEAVISPLADDGSRQVTITVHWTPEPEHHFVSFTSTLVSQ